MAHSKAMGIGAMFVLLVVAVILLPMIVRYIDSKERFVVSHFEDMMVQNIPTVPMGSNIGSDKDPNTDYLCRAPNGGSVPCPEGTFCDGSTQKCVQNFVGGEVPTVGYYA
jgi:hypothetical protein